MDGQTLAGDHILSTDVLFGIEGMLVGNLPFCGKLPFVKCCRSFSSLNSIRETSEYESCQLA